MSDRTRRTFVALRPPLELTRALCAAAEELLAARVWRRTPAEDVHATLHFLGEVDEATRERLARELARRLAGERAFELLVTGFGGFPSAASARIAWAGIGAGELDQLRAVHALAGDAVCAVGLAVDERAWTPHLTLARAAPGRRARLDAGAGAGAGATLPLAWEVDAVSLCVSNAAPERSHGTRYPVVASVPLIRSPG